MCSNDVQFDFSADFANSNYKSCFARSVVVNSQFQSKSLDFRQKIAKEPKNENMNEINVPKKIEEPVRRLSIPTRHEIPIEHLQLQSQVDLLHWQLKQAENSRQMYRAVMQQVVCFLERAHRSLDQIGAQTPRGKQDMDDDTDKDSNEYAWRRPKRQLTPTNETPPDKLSQEAFRLLRTAQSLLNTREPDLAHVSTEPHPPDQQFLSQLAKEFPARPQRATSFSLNPQIISPTEKDVRISTAFNRKLSLQKQELEKRNSITSIKKPFENEKLATSSVSSAEDESGFSSMNSFQEVGLPLVNSTVEDDLEITEASDVPTDTGGARARTWSRPEVKHRRWSSTPVDAANDALKVLWV